MDNVLSLIGLMYRAKKLVLGESVLENIESVKYLLIASDASDKTKERYLKKCSFYNIDYYDDFSSLELSKALGKENIKIIGIIDEGFKETLIKKIGGTYGKTNL